jgi:alpha-beta hydrolase superfamily lysophospholipase
LDELVDYVQEERFNQPIVLVEHSAGTLIGTLYAKAHPEKVAAVPSNVP